jgi:hypothetical protein
MSEATSADTFPGGVQGVWHDGAVIVTVTLALDWPYGPRAYSVYVVVCVGLSPKDPVKGRENAPGSKVRTVAFVEVQFSVVLWPRGTAIGEALSVTAVCGDGGGGTGNVIVFVVAQLLPVLSG